MAEMFGILLIILELVEVDFREMARKGMQGLQIIGMEVSDLLTVEQLLPEVLYQILVVLEAVVLVMEMVVGGGRWWWIFWWNWWRKY